MEELEYSPLQDSDLEALTSLVSRSIGIDETRGDKISVKNLQFKRDNSSKDDGAANEVLAFSQKYIAPFSGVLKYLFVIILLFVVYKKVISPFSMKMLEISKEDEELERPVLI
jgi:flagellar M-ring protein FliF